MPVDLRPGELVHNDKYTILMLSVDRAQLESIRQWADAYNKSMPSFIKGIILERIEQLDSGG
jgi:hypothetical protein